ncbi:E3 ubiquitin-protein ligase BRE1 [Pseudohyphozyma bogoriensis]|nr:E3 ubiquitin-protein ligase BRE1 [Pseudohyphozyma bogoriensis]
MNGLLPHKRVPDDSTSSSPAVAAKKQRVNSHPPSLSNRPSPSEPTSDDDGDGPTQDHDLENFRKEAIWREMQEYRRKFERAQATIDKLEQERKKADARLAAVDISWNLLVREADLLLPSTSTSNGHSHHSASSPSVSDPSLTDEELSEALAQRSAATKALLGRLEQLHPTSSAAAGASEKLQESCRVILEESLKSQESLRLLRASHEATVAQLEETLEELRKAEKKIDRLKSKTVAMVEGRPVAGAVGAASVEKMVNGTSPHPKSPAAEGPSGGVVTGETGELLDELRRLAEGRLKELDELRTERIALKSDLDSLRSKLSSPTEEMVLDSVPFRTLQSHVQYLTADADVRRVELEKVTQEANGLRELQDGFRKKINRETEEQVDEIQKRLLAKESDLTRIRAQREDLRSEAAEFRAKENEKIKNLDQLKTLAQSREERIQAYSSEVKRLKMQIAAARGDSATVDLYASTEEADIVNDLQTRLKSAEELLLLLRDQLRTYASASGSAESIQQSETDARLELSKAQDRLAKLEVLLGPEGNVEVRELVDKLQKNEERTKVLEAQVKSQDHAMNMLYGEIDRLSTAWSTLDEQNSSKVFNLVNLEEKVQRLNADKAKSESRYFSTMRQKEALVAENAVLTKLAEKQQRAVDASNDLQHSLGAQLAASEKEITAHHKNLRAHQESLSQVKRENAELLLRREQSDKHIIELTALLNERITEAETEQAARKRVEEHISKVERQLKSARLQSSSNTGESSQIRELQQHNDDLSQMLKCSTCKIRFKGVIINRCGHLFCRECVDARLSNRQRKCPSCGIGFGKDDVSNVFF